MESGYSLGDKIIPLFYRTCPSLEIKSPSPDSLNEFGKTQKNNATSCQMHVSHMKSGQFQSFKSKNSKTKPIIQTL